MSEEQDNRNPEIQPLFQNVQAQPLFPDTQTSKPPSGEPLFHEVLSEPGDASFVKTISNTPPQPLFQQKTEEPAKEEPAAQQEPAKEEPVIVPEQKPEPAKEEPVIVPEQKPEPVKEESPVMPEKPVQKHIPETIRIPGDPQDLSLGEIIKQARIAAGYSQEEAYQGTRICTRYQEAIETENFDVLPGGSFPAVYIRTLCRFYHLDAAFRDAAMEKVTAVCRKNAPPAKVYEEVQETVQINEAEQKRFRKILIWTGISAAILLLCIIGIILAISLSAPKHGDAEGPVSATSVEDLETLSAPQMPVMRKLSVPGK